MGMGELPLMQIKLDLKHHCIETAVRKLYNKSISQYFKTDSDKKKLEKQIDILKTVLEKGDFTHLRSTHRELAGHCQVNAAIRVDTQNRITLLLDGRPIEISNC
jgi:plasmid maintenance system killer protein